MTEGILDLIVLMVPDKRNGSSVVLLKRTMSDDAAIIAPEVVFSGPPTKVELLHSI
jgi:hypothetical protein